jgi:hypothetical protein
MIEGVKTKERLVVSGTSLVHSGYHIQLDVLESRSMTYYVGACGGNENIGNCPKCSVSANDIEA